MSTAGLSSGFSRGVSLPYGFDGLGENLTERQQEEVERVRRELEKTEAEAKVKIAAPVPVVIAEQSPNAEPKEASSKFEAKVMDSFVRSLSDLYVKKYAKEVSKQLFQDLQLNGQGVEEIFEKHYDAVVEHRKKKESEYSHWSNVAIKVILTVLTLGLIHCSSYFEDKDDAHKKMMDDFSTLEEFLKHRGKIENVVQSDQLVDSLEIDISEQVALYSEASFLKSGWTEEALKELHSRVVSKSVSLPEGFRLGSRIGDIQGVYSVAAAETSARNASLFPLLRRETVERYVVSMTRFSHNGTEAVCKMDCKFFSTQAEAEASLRSVGS